MNENLKSYSPLIDSSLINIALKQTNSPIRCPENTKIFRAFELCPLDDIKAVFIGQDPYPQKGVATGVLFGNSADTPEERLSPSLKIVKEACINYEIPHNNIIFDNTLESWGQQGILMLNSALTVKEGMPGSHALVWQPFISDFLKKLSLKTTGLVYVLFGKRAQFFQSYINVKYNTVFKVEHPAYFARIKKKMPYELFTNVNKEIFSKYCKSIKFYEEVLF